MPLVATLRGGTSLGGHQRPYVRGTSKTRSHPATCAIIMTVHHWLWLRSVSTDKKMRTTPSRAVHGRRACAIAPHNNSRYWIAKASDDTRRLRLKQRLHTAGWSRTAPTVHGPSAMINGCAATRRYSRQRWPRRRISPATYPVIFSKSRNNRK